MSASGPLIVAYDGSTDADAAIDAVPRLLTGPRAVVISVWESAAPLVSGSLIAIPAAVAQKACENLDRESERQATLLAEQGAERLRERGVEATASAVRSSGNTWSTIVKRAEQEDAAAVVLGSRGRSPVASALLGSVSAGVVHHGGRPVLVVHG